METRTINDGQYHKAAKRVKKLKGFYNHVFIYVLVNLFLIISKILFSDEMFVGIELLYTPIFWGFGLLAHGLSVFLPEAILGSDWEERKIRKIISKDQK